MRDMERWKDKVELSLDGRQIFFLFFGGAVAACLVFVMGVLVGRRIEARALALSPPPVEDPLAALDHLGDATELDDSLTYHQTLTDSSKRAESASQKTAEAAAPKTLMPVPSPSTATTTTSPTTKPPAKSEPAQLATKPAEPAKTAVAQAASAVKNEELPKPPQVPAITVAKAEAKGDSSKEVAAKLDAKDTKLEAKGEAKTEKLDAANVASKTTLAQPTSGLKKEAALTGRFTLQLSAFPERGDAEEFMKKMQSSGYKAFMVQSEVPGKGTFYRIRVGDYPTRESALSAKNEFERKQHTIAYVAKY